MSRWLNSVNSLLDQLDGRVETVVEEQAVAREGDDHPGQGKDAVESILAKRGLADEEEEEVAPVVGEEKGAPSVAEEKRETESVSEEQVDTPPDTAEGVEQHTDSDESAVATIEQEIVPKNHEEIKNVGPKVETSGQEDVKGTDELMEDVASMESSQDAPVDATSDEVTDTLDSKEGDAAAAALTEKEEAHAQKDESIVERPVVQEAAKEEKASTSATVVSEPPPQAVSKSAATPVQTFEVEYKKALGEARESQKEARTLRRHVVSLNSELEAAEAEIKAQRTELERAAERMEKDRARQKEEKETLLKQHAEELKALKAQHQQTLTETKARSDSQLEEARARMNEIEARRMQEGGDWTKELEGAVHREQEAMRRLAMLEDEKSTLLSQISSLQAQQGALENRLDSISQTADNAMEREREAEDRLDSALSIHARQLSQRQARESELERTIADLGAALVVARNKETARLKNAQGDSPREGGTSSSSSLRSKLEETQEDLETVTAQLDMERQRLQALHQDFQEMSQERAEESSAAHARQLQSDRKIADMSLTIARLQSNIREASRSSLDESRDSLFPQEDSEKSRQVKTLSEQVLQQQENISSLKSRLQVALSRASKAEEALSTLQTDDELFDRMESAPSSGNMNTDRRTMRRRGRKGGKSDYGGSIRAAIRLDPGQQGERGEKIGKAIDVVDSFSVETGKYLRHNPLARAAFIVYLLLLHFWTLALLVFHAHGYETVHGDFGAQGVPHGPHALMQAHAPNQESKP